MSWMKFNWDDFKSPYIERLNIYQWHTSQKSLLHNLICDSFHVFGIISIMGEDSKLNNTVSLKSCRAEHRKMSLKALYHEEVIVSPPASPPSLRLKRKGHATSLCSQMPGLIRPKCWLQTSWCSPPLTTPPPPPLAFEDDRRTDHSRKPELMDKGFLVLMVSHHLKCSLSGFFNWIGEIHGDWHFHTFSRS